MEPPVEVPTNVPMALSVTSKITKLNVNAEKLAPTPPACVVQVRQTIVKSPKLMLEGTPVVLDGFGENVSVAAAPDELLKVKPSPAKAVPAALVVKVIVAALALAVIKTNASPAVDSA